MTTITYPFKLIHNNGYAVFPFVFKYTKINSVRCVISSRTSGSMGYDPKIANSKRLTLFNTIKINAERIFACKQTHSQDVIFVGKDSVEKKCNVDRTENFAGIADGLVSCGDAILAVTVADCLPVFLFDTVTEAFSVVHSGWKGTGIAHNALMLMSEKFGTQAKDVACVLGPCIQSCCYHVDEERAIKFHKEFGSGMFFPLGDVTIAKGDSKPNFFLNMQAATAHILAKDGVENIAYCTDCTFTDENLGSFRREGESFTKMAALVGRF